MANNYSIVLSDGSRTINIPENVVDKDTLSLALIGHGQPNYGEPQNENFIHMLENFSSEVEPNMPIKGQLWCKKNINDNTYELRICSKSASTMEIDDGNGGFKSDAEWDKIMITTPGGGEPVNPSDGDMWYDTKNHKLKIYDSSLKNPDYAALNGWNVIGPKDAIHNDNNYFTINTISEPTSRTSTTSSFLIDSSYFAKDIYEGLENEQQYTGSLHLVTLKVLIKEVIRPDKLMDANLLRSSSVIYRFVVRTISSESGKFISIVGAPNYEIIAKSDNLDFTMDAAASGTRVLFTITNNSLIDKTYFVNGVDMEITRV